MKLSSQLFPEMRASSQRGIYSSCFMTRKLFLTFPSFLPGLCWSLKTDKELQLVPWLTVGWSDWNALIYPAGKESWLQDIKISSTAMPNIRLFPSSQIPTSFKFQQYLILWVWNVARHGFSFKTLSGWIEPSVLSWIGEFTLYQQANYNCSTLVGWGRISGSSTYCPNPIQITDTW